MFPATPLPRKIGDYVVVRRLRNEGPVEVLLAREEGPLGFQREVALKCVRRDPATAGAATELAREARVCSRLVSPGIVRVLGLFEDSDRVVLVLEHVEGATLAGVLAHLEATGQRLDDGAAAYIGATVAAALAFAHSLADENGTPTPVLHRAVSPNAVLVARDGTVKLTGFGLAKILDRTPDSVVGMVKGAAGYLAPEQARGETATEKADVFSVGMLCHRLLAGPAKIGTGGIVQLVAGRPAQLGTVREGLPRELCAAVDAALSEDVRKRSITCAELARWIGKVQKLEEGKAALREIVAVMPQEGDDPAPRPERPSRRRQRLTGKRSVLGQRALRASRPGLELDLDLDDELDEDEEEDDEGDIPGPRIATDMGIGPPSVPPGPAAAPVAEAPVGKAAPAPPASTAPPRATAPVAPSAFPAARAPTPPPKGTSATGRPAPRAAAPLPDRTPPMPSAVPMGKALTPMPARARSEPPKAPHLPAPPPHPPHAHGHHPELPREPGRLRTPVPMPTADGMVEHTPGAEPPAASVAPVTEDVTESDLLRSVPPVVGKPTSVRPVPIPDTAKFLTPTPEAVIEVSAPRAKMPVKTLLGLTPPPAPAEPIALALTPPPAPHPVVPDEPKVVGPPEAEPYVPPAPAPEPTPLYTAEPIVTQRFQRSRRGPILAVLGGVGLLVAVIVIVAVVRSPSKAKSDDKKDDVAKTTEDPPPKKAPKTPPSASTSATASAQKPPPAEPTSKAKAGHGFLRVHTDKVGKVFVSGNPTGDPEAILEAPCGRKYINLARLDDKGKWKAWLTKGTLATVTCDGKVTDVTLP